jgi:hypothetical protein
MPFKFPGEDEIKDLPVRTNRTYDVKAKLYTVSKLNLDGVVLDSFSSRYSREANKVRSQWAHEALSYLARLYEEGKIT